MDKIWTSFRGRPSAPLAQGEYLRAWRELTSGGKAQATFGGVSVEWALAQVSMRSGRDFWFNRPWRAWRAWPPRAAVARSKPHRPGFRWRHFDGAGAGETRRAGFRAPENRPGEPADSPGLAPRDRRRSESMAGRVGRAAKPGRAAPAPAVCPCPLAARPLRPLKPPPRPMGRMGGFGRCRRVPRRQRTARSSRGGNSPAARPTLRDRPPRRSHPWNSPTLGYRPARGGL